MRLIKTFEYDQRIFFVDAAAVILLSTLLLLRRGTGLSLLFRVTVNLLSTNSRFARLALWPLLRFYRQGILLLVYLLWHWEERR